MNRARIQVSSTVTFRRRRKCVRCLPFRRPLFAASGSLRTINGRLQGVESKLMQASQIVECVPHGRTPVEPWGATFDASRHVVLPGLINAHHHFYQTLTRAHPAGFGRELIPWLVAMERVWGRMTPEALRLAVRMALVELLMSGCT